MGFLNFMVEFYDVIMFPKAAGLRATLEMGYQISLPDSTNWPIWALQKTHKMLNVIQTTKA